jgi:hypothetical protein
MESIDITPNYTTNELPGRCIKCKAEEKLFSCMRELFEDDQDSAELKQKYRILKSFLESSELQRLCDETEKCLSEGKEASVRIYLQDGKPMYELKIKTDGDA